MGICLSAFFFIFSTAPSSAGGSAFHLAGLRPSGLAIASSLDSSSSPGSGFLRSATCSSTFAGDAGLVSFALPSARTTLSFWSVGLKVNV